MTHPFWINFMHYATQRGVQVKTVISLVPGFFKFTNFFLSSKSDQSEFSPNNKSTHNQGMWL